MRVERNTQWRWRHAPARVVLVLDVVDGVVRFSCTNYDQVMPRHLFERFMEPVRDDIERRLAEALAENSDLRAQVHALHAELAHAKELAQAAANLLVALSEK